MSEEKIKQFRLYDGVHDEPQEEERRPVHLVIVLFFCVIFWSFLALKFGGWVFG